MAGPEHKSRIVEFSADLFAALDRATRSDGVLTRQPYGPGEQAAHDLVAAVGEELGLARHLDAAGNLHLTFPGADTGAPSWVTGSHLDSVPDGGNFDGAAGVVAPLAVMREWRNSGFAPARNVTVIAFRAEEASSWFAGRHHSHFGSRALLGQLAADELHQTRSLVDGRTLANWISAAGFDAEGIRAGTPLICLDAVGAFVELHIEQGPVLVATRCPAGIVTGIRGTLRARSCRCIGEDAHSGAVPLEYRHDALFGAAEFACELERQWHRWLAQGQDAVCTVGRFGTDPARHSMTKIAGEVSFSIDIRSLDHGLLLAAEAFVQDLAQRIGAARGLRFDLGSLDLTPPALMTGDLQRRLQRHADELGVAARPIASGAGHDAANFAAAGIPTAMIFVRNDHGSHNRHEAMNMDDFRDCAAVLGRLLAS